MVKKKLKTHLPHQTDFHRLHLLAFVVMALGVLFISVATYKSDKQKTVPSRVMERYVITKMYNIIEERNSLMVHDGSMIMAAKNNELGDFLTDQLGRTLYRFTDDTADASNCYNECAKKWPFLWTSGQVIFGTGVEGDLNIIDRTDGPGQVTYNDLPLYYFAGDIDSGDTNGHGIKDKWFVVKP